MAPIVATNGTGPDSPRRRWLAAALLAAAVAPGALTGGCAWLQDKERQLALRPTPGRPADFAGLRPGDQAFTVPVASHSGATERLALWWLPQPDAGAPALLYLHGTFRNLYRNLPKIDALREAGFAVVAVDYRGWGDSTPITPSEATITADAWRAWTELVERQPDPARRVIFGHSMGSAIAVTLASQLHVGRDYHALVLESAFTSMPDVARKAGFWGGVGALVTTQQFDSLSRIGRVDAPIFMLHGSADKTVPIALGERLRDAAPPGVHWVEIPGGTHSRLHAEAPALYQATMRSVMDTK